MDARSEWVEEAKRDAAKWKRKYMRLKKRMKKVDALMVEYLNLEIRYTKKAEDLLARMEKLYEKKKKV